MPQALFTSRAKLDLLEIALHISGENTSAADRWLENIDEKCQTLAQIPDLGRSRPDLAPKLRGLAVGNYVIFYLPIPDGIHVIRVLHGARDIPPLFE